MFWYVMQYNLVEVYCLLAGEPQPDYTASHPKWYLPSFSRP
jgi:hypothetical protein